MSKNLHPQRRDFLKTAAAGAAGAMGISALKFDKLFAQSTGGVWTTGMQINPAIDNTRVICCHDPSMLPNYPTSMAGVKATFANQNSWVDPAKIATNMDQMAMQLAQKTNAADAWSTIFRTGNSGGWGSTRVAIKVNGINGGSPTSDTINRTRVAVVKKICDVLVDQLGVKPANIVLYDACDNASNPYSTYVDANDSTKIRAATVSVRAAGLGGFAAVTLTNATGISAPADLVNGKIDILVNMPTCKMHNGTGGKYSYGTCTLGMKNHLGTFTDASQAQHSDGLHNLKAIFEINQHSAILGGNPVRQQLVIVDALLSNGASGPGGAPDNRTDRLVMGTFAPMVDYFTANYILFDPTIMVTSPIPQPGLTAAATTLPQFATSFGYTAPSASPTSPDPSWISYPASSPPPINPSGTGGTGGGSGGAASGGTKASGGAGSGGTSAGSGGTKASGGSASGGTSASGGSASGGTSASGGSATGGSKASGGAASGGTNASGGADSGGNNASGGSASGGTTSGSGGASGTGGASASASGGSPTTGGTTSGNRTGGSSGSAGSTAKGGNSDGGCDVAGVDRRATRWGAMLAFGAVVAEKLRRLVSGNDRSS